MTTIIIFIVFLLISLVITRAYVEQRLIEVKQENKKKIPPTSPPNN